MELHLLMIVAVFFGVFFLSKILIVLYQKKKHKRIEFLTPINTKKHNGSNMKLYYNEDNIFVYLKEENDNKYLIIQTNKSKENILVATYNNKQKLLSKFLIEKNNKDDAISIPVDKKVEFLTIDSKIVLKPVKDFVFKLVNIIIDLGLMTTFLTLIFFVVGIYQAGIYFKYFYNNDINNYLIIYLVIIGILTAFNSYRINTEYQEVIS